MRPAASAALLLLTLGAAYGWAATPVPPFPPDGVAVAGVNDAYDELRDFLRYYESRVGAQYHVAIVDLSDPLDRRGPEYGDDTGDYIDAVVDAWRAQLDPATHITVVLALGNREVLIQPGSNWVRLGYGGRVVGEVTDRSPFGLYARSGDFSRAVTELVRFIDADLLRRQRDGERRQEAIGYGLEGRRERLRVLEDSLPIAAFDTASVAPLAVEAADEIRRAEEAVDRGDVERAERALHDAEGALTRAERAWGEAESAYVFRTEKLPIIVGVAAVLVVFFAFLALYNRSRRWRDRARNELDTWSRKLDQAGQRLLQVESENATLLGLDDLATRFKGETAPEVRRVAERLDNLFLSLAAAQKLLHAAREESGRVGRLGVAGHRAALARLESGEVVVRSEDVRERRLFLPDEREVRRRASELLAEMDADYDALSRELGDLDGRIGQVWSDVERGVRRLASCETALGELAAHEANLAPYATLVERRREEIARVASAGQQDPLGQAEATSDLVRRIDALGERLTVVQEVLETQADRVEPIAENAQVRLRHLRDREGMRVLEPGFEPDRMLEHIAEQARAALVRLGEGEEDEARVAIHEAAETAGELAELLEASVASRTSSKQAINRLTALRGQLRERIPAARAQLERLAGAHADSALQPALDNADEAEAALAFATSCLSEATSAVTVTEQRYLAGAELVRRATETLERVEALFDEVDAKERELEARRVEAEAGAKALAAHTVALRTALEAEAPHLSATSVELIEALCEREAALIAHAEAERPDWIALAAEAEAVLQAASELSGRVASEEAAHAELPALLAATREERQTLRRRLDASSEDRPPANAALEAGERRLDEVERRAAEGRPEWPVLLAELKEARAQIDEAGRLATLDFDRADQARQALARAEAAVRAANVIYGYGIVADLSPSRSALERARAALTTQQFEEALAVAATARQAAGEARLAAQRRVSQRTAAEARQRSSSWSSSSGSSSGRSSSSRSHSSFSSSRSSSRSSSSSSFGSSSGRSSFGRSSGRSKW